MRKMFYYHPDRSKEVGDALIAGTLVATADQLIQCEYLPLVGENNEPVIGWWIDTFEESDWFLMPPVPAPLLVYPAMLHELSNMILGAHN